MPSVNVAHPQPQPVQHLFLYSAINSEGQSVTERIAMPSLAAARYALKLRGYSSILFHTDQTQRVMEQLCGVSFTEDELLAPARDLASRTAKGVWGHLSFVFATFTPVWLVLLIWNAMSLFMGPPYGWVARLGFLLSLFCPGYLLWKSLPGAWYQCLLDARVWARWEDVQKWVKRLRRLQRFQQVAIPDLELDMSLATALAGQGKLHEALALVAKYEQDETVPRAMFYGRLSGVYENAQDYTMMAKLRAQAVDHNPEGTNEPLDYAVGLVLRLHDSQAARQALEKINDKEITSVAAPYVSFCEGLIALEENRADDAQRYFVETLNRTTLYTDSGLMPGFVLEVKSQLVIVLGWLGEKGKAARLFAEVEPFLQAHRETEILARCRQAVH